MTIVATAAVPRHLDLAGSDTVRLTVPTLADQVHHLTAQGLGIVQVATRLRITAYAAFEAGARVRQPGDVAAVEATMPVPTPAQQAVSHAWAVWVAAHTLDEIADHYDVSLFLAGAMQDVAHDFLDELGKA